MKEETVLVKAKDGFVVFAAEAEAGLCGCLYEPGKIAYSQALNSISLPVNQIQLIIEDSKYTNILIHPGNGSRVYVPSQKIKPNQIRKVCMEAKKQIEEKLKET